MSKHDLCKQPYSMVADPKIQFLNRNAEVIKIWKAPLHMTSWDTLYYRLRANFDGLKSEYVPEPPKLDITRDGRASYESGCNVMDVKHSDGLVTLNFESTGGSGTLHADLVVAADGPASTLRRILYPELKRKYVGYAAWRGTAVESEVSDQTKAHFGTCCNFFTHKSGHMLMYACH